MRILDFSMYIFYKYYSKGSTRSIPYISALLAISLLIFMNALALMVFIGIDTENILPIIEIKGRVNKLLSGALIILPLFIVLRLILPKKRVEKLEFSKRAVQTGNIGMIFYILLSIALIVIAVETS